MNDFRDRVYNYNKCLVTYIDILGFAARIKASREDASKIGQIARLIGEILKRSTAWKHLDHDAEGNPKEIFDSFSFSDLTVRSTRISDEEKLRDIIVSELFFLCEMQFSLALEGVWMRGGMCLGDLFVDTSDPKNSIAFGPALVKSYELESIYAIYPRIVIDRDLVAPAEHSGDSAYFQDYYRRGEDGAYFVDYLFGRSIAGFTLSTPNEASPISQIEAHRKMVEASIEYAVGQGDESIKKKCIWLALYHNRTIKLLAHRSRKNLNDLFIPENMLSF